MQVVKIRYNDIDAPAMFADSLQKTGFGVVADHPIHFDLKSGLQEWEEFLIQKKNMTTFLILIKMVISRLEQKMQKAIP